MDLTLPTFPHLTFASAARARICLTYLWRHGRLPDLDDPQSFTEWVQWRKLHERDMQMPMLADKVRVKDFVADRIGAEWVTATYWHGSELPSQPDWQPPFIVKSRHGCDQYAVVLDRQANWDKIRRKAQGWMKHGYGRWLDEWLYNHIPRGILVEPYIGDGQTLPIDYKFYVFGGRVELVQVHLDRNGRHSWLLFDPEWRRVSSPTGDDPAPPQSLQMMIDAAEALARDFDFVRIDHYEVGGKPVFGEMSFYPGSGLDPFDPVSLDGDIGAYWTAARAGLRCAK